MGKGLEEFVVRTQQDAEKQSQSDKKTSDGKRARMQQEASQLRTQLNNAITASREREQDLRKVCTSKCHSANDIRMILF